METWLQELPALGTEMADYKWEIVEGHAKAKRGRGSCGLLLGWKVTDNLKYVDKSVKKCPSKDLAQWISAEFEINGVKTQIIGLYRHDSTPIDKLSIPFDYTLPILLIGDINIRIGANGSWFDSRLARRCKDKKEYQADSFLKYMAKHQLVVLNGNWNGDADGKYTREASKSTIDYGCANEKLLVKIEKFQVELKKNSSDHNPLMVRLSPTGVEGIGQKIATRRMSLRLERELSSREAYQLLNDLVNSSKLLKIKFYLCFLKLTNKAKLTREFLNNTFNDKNTVQCFKSMSYLIVIAADVDHFKSELENLSSTLGTIDHSNSAILLSNCKEKLPKICCCTKELSTVKSFEFDNQDISFKAKGNWMAKEVKARVEKAIAEVKMKKTKEVFDDVIKRILIRNCETWKITKTLLKSISTGQRNIERVFHDKPKNFSISTLDLLSKEADLINGVNELLLLKKEWISEIKDQINRSEIVISTLTNKRISKGRNSEKECEKFLAVDREWRKCARTVDAKDVTESVK